MNSVKARRSDDSPNRMSDALDAIGDIVSGPPDTDDEDEDDDQDDDDQN